ncbi:exodeoxyribonuclease V subunit gamma [Mycobacterium paragordonae]|uniref:RecBCD enzyme subunit RecC n=1 Tax=Mycobacterium paragordonae TaxID=1389713 RepID=A0A4R5WVN7_9MYCO|nr:exodeoxyribonuclease V subunit gamma [Mycobacterium paragordonae]MDP7736970.1 exodeoxyribonuclease V subunit gamma [Mycobacterium paragordonae]TDK98648.1 exodeoxyribonuclease V subunit gamma [Mycobacterium paragordonae]TDL08970.1 exodeoxyribonuclease V subunit gamma [Mycobacterium paragordonae]
MALHLHRAERTDLLADGLGALLTRPLPDPFAQELVLVPARGVERWLSQRLSHRLGAAPDRGDGVCAGVLFRNPASLIAEIVGTVDNDPWSPDAMTWPLLQVIDASLAEPWCRTLAKHLGHFDIGDEAELRRGRRYAVARRLAGLFASYARQRPGLLVDWLAGDLGDLDADLHWQPELWRALVATIPADPPHVRHRTTLARLREGPAALPPRLSLFGHTRLARSEIELLEAVAVHHDLHLWLPHPSDTLWRALGGVRGTVLRRADTSHREVGHPLLATLGRDLRELQRSLPGDPATDEALGEPDRRDTLLGWLQADLAANAVRSQGRTLAHGDRSVQVHSCHGPARQIDVLREVLLGLLADDPTLEPRDILVMCPDIETYAPLIVADFGLGDVVNGAHPAHRLRVRLADRSLLQTNPLLGVASQLLSLAGGRVTSSEVLNLAQAAPVRARFGFSDDDLEGITRWVRQSNIRWGFDQEHRKPFGVDFVHNTWRFGLDRVLAGVAMSETAHAWIDSTLPLDDVGSNRIELVGQFAEYIDRLQRVVDSLTAAQPLRQWLTALADGIGLLTHTAEDDAWQTNQMQREFADVLRTAGSRDQTLMRLPDIRALLQRHLAGRPTRANFRTGTLTVCTMVPMRSVPHRVVCLVGLDDGVFPRLGVVDGDDVLARQPLTGERDIRSEDRQLLLDAIGAATSNLVITYTGANEYSGQRRPPAVPLAELLDALDMTTAEPVRPRIMVEHPLQPFDVRNVERGALVPDAPFSFDPTVLRAARSATGERSEQPGLICGLLAAPPPDDVVLADLVAFFKDPVKGFFRALEYTLPWDVDGVEDAMPVDINALEEWTVGDRMLSDILGGLAPDDARQAEWRRGTLPPGQLGWRKVTDIRDQAALLASAALAHRRGHLPTDSATYDVDIDLGGRRVTGTVSQVFGDRLVSVTYSKLDGKHLLQSWIPLLALHAHQPDRDWSAVCIGRPKRGTTPREEHLGRPGQPALDVLRDLVAIYDAGRREPIPLPIKTSYAWAVARHCGDDPVKQAEYRWRSGLYPGEDEDQAQVRAWGRHARLTDLMQPLRPGEQYPAFAKGEEHRLGAFAARLWLPLLQAELRAERRFR